MAGGPECVAGTVSIYGPVVVGSCSGCHANYLLLKLQVIANARALGARLMKYGYKLVTDGTDNHLVLWDMRKEVTPPDCTWIFCGQLYCRHVLL